MGEWTMQEMMNLVEGYADLMKKAERGDATEAQCTGVWEAIRRVAESWEISARQCQAFWEEATTWRGAFVRKNGLAYCGQQKAIVRMDTEKPYLPPREFPPVWTSALDLEREKWAQICDGFDAANPHIGQAAEVAKLLRSNAEVSGAGTASAGLPG